MPPRRSDFGIISLIPRIGEMDGTHHVSPTVTGHGDAASRPVRGTEAIASWARFGDGFVPYIYLTAQRG